MEVVCGVDVLFGEWNEWWRVSLRLIVDCYESEVVTRGSVEEKG